ncbi:hypothetical protein BX265_7545 [Streptomyces sp. TLI_235]|nr:FAD-dependent oxidoreductase [Streptomyces sp. TLI_235]PBC70153.1 hypothetical protein BX265_7545 [Streptomyces sp. TLI_235]
MTDTDLAFVGGGFRTTGFLASAPDLLAHRVDVFERSAELGPGGFADYAITSTSVGSRFLKECSYRGPFAGLREDPRVARVARAEEPVPMAHLAAALGRLGETLAGVLGDRVHLDTEVEAVDLAGDGSGAVLRLRGGRTVECRHAVLATGRTERPHPELAPWSAKTLRSAEVISRRGRDAVRRRIAGLEGGRIAVAGSSHSAMSALRVLLELFDETRRTRPDYRAPSVDVVQRGPARLMYPSLREAVEGLVPGRERPADPETDVCPATGIVYRDSGLRHESRALYCALWAGEVPQARIVRAARLTDADELLDRADLVVQALGYHGHAPDLLVDGRPARPGDSAERLAHTEDGAAIVGGLARPALSVLRIEPTPTALRDHAVYGSGLYARLADRLRLALPAPEPAR